jgi:hypothetical protein
MKKKWRKRMVEVAKFTKSIGIPRNELPQIDFDHYDDILSSLKKSGIDCVIGKVSCDKLKPSQDDLNKEKVQSMLDNGSYNEDRTLFVSKEGFIVDGHHTWAAKYSYDKKMPIKVVMVKMNIIDLINWFNSQDFTYTKEIHESKGR